MILSGRPTRLVAAILPLAVGLLLPGPAGTSPLSAQPTTERTPNLPGTWVTSHRNLHFDFAHRFEVLGQDASGADIFSDGELENYPTFDLAYGLFDNAMLGVRFSSNSRTARPDNEWQPYVKYAPMRGTEDGEFSLAATVAWNGSAGSLDGEIVAQTQLDRLLFIGAVRGFTDGFELPDGRSDEILALAGGMGVKVNRYVTLGGDVAGLAAGLDAPVAWSGGIGIGIPATPHTFSIIATNVYSGTLEGASAGDADGVFWGFEFTVPFSGFARWGAIIHPSQLEDEEGREALEEIDRPVVEIEIKKLEFEHEKLTIPVGTTVRWINKDPVGHTSTADEGQWSSPLIGPGETYTVTFSEPGRYPYHCTPHPFMTAEVVVMPEEDGE